MASSDCVAPRLLEGLREVVVAPDLSGYRIGDFEVEAGAAELEPLLARDLYRSLHAGLERGDDNGISIRSPEVEESLLAAVPHSETEVHAPIVENGPEKAVAILDGLRVDVGKLGPDANKVDEQHPVLLRIPAARPSLSPGFLLVDGSRGCLEGKTHTRVYVHITRSEKAPEIWHSALRHLEETGIRYRAKVCSSADLYPRRDALVVYLGEHESDRAIPLASELAGMSGIGNRISVFARALAPGIGVAMEPRDSRDRHRPVSFGQHRSEAVAAGVLAGLRHAAGSQQRLAEAMLRANINPVFPELNSGERACWGQVRYT